MQDSRGGQGGGEEQEEFLDLCDKVKQMTEEKARKRKHEDSPSGLRPPAPSLVYGPIDWRVPPEKEKEIKEKAMRKLVVEDEEDKGEMEDEAVVEEEEGMNVLAVPKKKGKIKRRGKKKGKRNKPDREEEEKKKKEGENAMEDC